MLRSRPLKPRIVGSWFVWPRLGVALVAWSSPLAAADLVIEAPREWQVIQRRDAAGADVPVRIRITPAPQGEVVVESRLGPAAADPLADGQGWNRLAVTREGDAWRGTVVVPAGGWHRLQLRAVPASAGEAQPAASAIGTVERIGVGEVFVVAGQSNSANHGEVRQRPTSGRVATFDGQAWRIADDPQPGASGAGGSFMPPLGDLLVAEFDVPVGFVACGIGASSVREWLPADVPFANPPTIEARVRRREEGQWHSDGAAYAMVVERMRSLGPRGFRAVLWHQGESDANQADPKRTLPGDRYREYLETLVVRSRRDIGWQAPWMVAQASYHVPGDEGSDDIRAAQAAVAAAGIAVAGPDSDALKGVLREAGGRGVHFSGPGLVAHAGAWAEKIVPWIRGAEPPR